jgi:hypothetical protein
LCFGTLQITMTTPRRRMILHFSQRFLIDARTFNAVPFPTIADGPATPSVC